MHFERTYDIKKEATWFETPERRNVNLSFSIVEKYQLGYQSTVKLVKQFKLKNKLQFPSNRELVGLNDNMVKVDRI